MHDQHIHKLEKEHQALDKKIDTMEKTGIFDDHQLNILKKQRLAVRDELSKLDSFKNQSHNQSL